MTYNSPRVYNMTVFDIEPRYKETNNTIMTLSEMLKRFREKFLVYTSWVGNKKELSKLTNTEDVEDFLTQTYTSMVEAEVERLKALRKKTIPNMLQDDELYNLSGIDGVDGYNQAIEYQINYWKNKLN